MTEALFFASKQPWVADAACAGEPVDIFFEAGWEDEAITICDRCAVGPECLAQAMLEEGDALDGRYGVRGGLTAVDRTALVKYTRTNNRTKPNGRSHG